MPRVPKWWGDSIEKLFNNMIHPVEVSNIDYLTPTLAKIRFVGDLSKVQFIPGNVVEFRINETDYRHYTLSDFGKDFCEVIFYLHDKGIGSRWAQHLRIGDKIKLMGPGGKIKYQPEYERHVIFGDETGIGLMSCMQNKILKEGKSVISILEMDEGHEQWVHFAGKETVFVHSDFDNPGQPVIDLINRTDFWQSTDDLVFYLTGRAKSIRNVKEFLLMNGVTSKQIKVEPYWTEGKQGL